MSQSCPLIIVGIKCSYHLFYVFYQTRALAWMANITLPLCSGLPPTIRKALRFYANIQIISSNTQKKFKKMHCGKVQRLGEEGWWLTKQMKQLDRSLLDWAEYAYVLLFITIVITVYSIFYLFWATKPRKKRTRQINSARWPPRSKHWKYNKNSNPKKVLLTICDHMCSVVPLNNARIQIKKQ